MDTVDREIEECSNWSDEELTKKLGAAAGTERETLVSILIRLGEFIKRDLPLEKGYSSVYDYCMRKLGYSRTAAARRIAAAKAARSYRSILRMLLKGDIHLTAVAMLSKHLNSDNYEALLSRAKGHSEEEVDRIIASIAPRPIPRERIVAVRAHARSAPSSSPANGTAAASAAPPEGSGAQAEMLSGALFAPPPASEPAPEASPDLYDVRFPADAETVDLIRRAKEVLRHKFPRGETGSIVKHALKKLLAEVDRDLRKHKKPGEPKAQVPAEPARDSRRIPEAVKQEAWDRCDGQCAFVADDGNRCTARAWIQFDHIKAYAKGGSSTDPNNIQAYCWPHNQFVARREFGDRMGPTAPNGPPASPRS
ncbi:MAG: hypothetical protein HY553_06115 [Elusimicrobia bacterium]|nr:hypothetical protein [Elusimicrobiota bacterium]